MKKIYMCISLLILLLTVGTVSAGDVADNDNALTVSEDIPVAEMNDDGDEILSEIHDDGSIPDLAVDVK